MINESFPLYYELLESVDDALKARYSSDRLCSSLSAVLEAANVSAKKYISTSIELLILHHSRISGDRSVVPYGGKQKETHIEHAVNKLPTILCLIIYLYVERCYK